MYKKILVPLDGSKRAESILPHVEGLARCLDGEIILLLVYRTGFSEVEYYGHDPEFYEALRANCREEAPAYLNGVAEERVGGGLRVEVMAEEGPVTGSNIIIVVLHRIVPVFCAHIPSHDKI